MALEIPQRGRGLAQAIASHMDQELRVDLPPQCSGPNVKVTRAVAVAGETLLQEHVECPGLRPEIAHRRHAAAVEGASTGFYLGASDFDCEEGVAPALAMDARGIHAGTDDLADLRGVEWPERVLHQLALATLRAHEAQSRGVVVQLTIARLRMRCPMPRVLSRDARDVVKKRR